MCGFTFMLFITDYNHDTLICYAKLVQCFVYLYAMQNSYNVLSVAFTPDESSYK
jgi:hypothetical protein